MSFKQSISFPFLLATLVLTLFGACGRDKISEEKPDVNLEQLPLVNFILDSKEPISVNYNGHYEKVFDYTKIPFGTVALDDFNSEESEIDSLLRVLIIQDTDKLSKSSIDRIIKYVSNGGTLVIPFINEDPRLSFLIGMKPEALYNYDLNSSGIQFLTNMIPGMKNKKIYRSRKNSALAYENFKNNIRIIACAADNPNQPTILENSVGNGKVIYFNTNIQFEKVDRGLLFAATLSGLSGVPFPIANVSSIFIDDFPGPLYHVYKEPVKSSNGMAQDDFVAKQWWPDMLSISEKYNIPYSAYTIFNYDRIMSPPFLFQEWENDKIQINGKIESASSWLAHQVLSNDFELAFHGYNHEPLLEETWTTKENIATSLAATRKEWKVNRFGSYPITYVPPSNMIDKFGLQQIKNSMPELKYMCSTYDGELAEGGDRDFDIDPFEPYFFDIPRITSGYIFDDQKIYEQQSLYLYSGIWTHFIHPDDVFQIPDKDNKSAGKYAYRNENSLPWRKDKNSTSGMYEKWDAHLETVVNLHSFNRFMKVRDAGPVIQEWRKSKYFLEKSGGFYSLKKMDDNKSSQQDFYWMMYISKENEQKVREFINKANLEFDRIDLSSGAIYSIKSREPNISFSMSTIVKKSTKFYGKDVHYMVLEDIKDFEEARIESQNNDEESADESVEKSLEIENKIITDTIAWLLENDKFDELYKLMTKKLLSSSKPNDKLFQDFAKYAAYQDMSQLVWKVLDSLYSYKSKEVALSYHDQYLEKEDYQDDSIAKLWLQRKVKQDPNNFAILREYDDRFRNNENENFLNDQLQNGNFTGNDYAQFISFLIQFKPLQALEELQDKNPIDYTELWPLANEITYLFTDNGRLREALNWSEYSKEIDILTRLQWLADLQAYTEMQELYNGYIKEHPENDSATLFVANTWFDVGEYERASLIALNFNEGAQQNEFKNRFNGNVVQFEPDVQKYLIVNTGPLFQPDTLQKIEDALRINENDWIEFKTAYVNDIFNQSVWDNTATYHHRTKKLLQHSFSATHSEVSDLLLVELDPANVPHTLFGLRYQFQTNDKSPKPLLITYAGFERDDFNKYFYNLGASVSKSGKKSFRSIGVAYAPVKTGPALTQNIYMTELLGYYEYGNTNFLQYALAGSGNFYSDNANQASITGRLFFNLERDKKSRFSPYVEGFASAANRNQLDGNPYWIIEDRIYTGGGLAWTYGKELNKLNVRLEAGAFADSYTDFFMRFNGQASYPIWAFTYVTGQFELFNQALYYSNGFQFGIKHYLKRTRPYYYKPRNY